MKLIKGYEFTYKTYVKREEMATGYIEQVCTVFFPGPFRIALDLAKKMLDDTNIGVFSDGISLVPKKKREEERTEKEDE